MADPKQQRQDALIRQALSALRKPWERGKYLGIPTDEEQDAKPTWLDIPSGGTAACVLDFERQDNSALGVTYGDNYIYIFDATHSIDKQSMVPFEAVSLNSDGAVFNPVGLGTDAAGIEVLEDGVYQFGFYGLFQYNITGGSSGVTPSLFGNTSTFYLYGGDYTFQGTFNIFQLEVSGGSPMVFGPSNTASQGNAAEIEITGSPMLLSAGDKIQLEGALATGSSPSQLDRFGFWTRQADGSGNGSNLWVKKLS